MCVCVPTTAETRPSRYQPIATFSEVASPCMSTKMTLMCLGIFASSASATRNGSSVGGMNTRPCRFRTAASSPDRVFKMARPRPGLSGGIIGRPQDPRIFGKVRHDLFLVPDVIAGGEHIDAPIEEFIRNFRRHAKPGRGILAVQDREIDCVILPAGISGGAWTMVRPAFPTVSPIKRIFMGKKEKPRIRRVAPLI